MSNDKPKRRKISFYLSNAQDVKFVRGHKESGLSISDYIRACIFDSDTAEQLLLAQILAETGQLKSELKAQGLLSEDIARELQLNRTILMSRMGRRS